MLKGKKIYLHRLIFALFGRFQVDHADKNHFNNRLSNLRPCDHSQNMANSAQRNKNKYGYRGIFLNKTRWVAQVQHKQKVYRECGFLTAKDAAKAYDKLATKVWGRFATLNFPKDKP